MTKRRDVTSWDENTLQDMHVFGHLTHAKLRLDHEAAVIIEIHHIGYNSFISSAGFRVLS